MRFTKTIATVAVALAMLAQPAFATATGTGDDPRPTKNVETALDAQAEAQYQAWLRRQGPTAKGTLSVKPTAIDAPYKYFYTPTHMQEKNYYCGPATVQVIDDYWGAPASQSDIAKYLGTDAAKATDFSKVDNAINYFAQQDYVYYGPCTSTSDFNYRVAYGLGIRLHPMATDMKIDGSVMANYVFDHNGHIVPLEAFDWRSMIIRLNDPYDERDWQPGGGATGGHVTYPAAQIAKAVMSHFRKAVVY